MNAAAERVETVVIGGAQAGLSVGYHLAKRNRPFVILEASERVGDVWRERFDSLRLYSPAQYDGLPGMRFPAKRWSFPTKDEVADYLEAYAGRFSLPVRTGTRVESLVGNGSGYVVQANGVTLEAENVVVASGTFPTPIVPGFARELDPAITQLHSNDYRNPSQLQEGPVLVVGAAHSGGDIAYEVAPTHRTILSGPVRGEIPFRLDGRAIHVVLPVMWFAANHVLTMRTPIGRKARAHIRSEGGPLLRVKRKDLAEAGVEHTEAKVAGIRDGKPELDDGRIIDVANVVWCTGFDKDVSWIEIPVTGKDGWPEQSQGAVPSSPGLYFVGLPFLQAFASMLIGGVGADAERVAKQIASREGAS